MRYEIGLTQAMITGSERIPSLDYVIKIANTRLEKNPNNWFETSKVLLYTLASDTTEQLSLLFDKFLTSAPLHLIFELSTEVDEFLHIFPHHADALGTSRVLKSQLRNQKPSLSE